VAGIEPPMLSRIQEKKKTSHFHHMDEP